MESSRSDDPGVVLAIQPIVTIAYGRKTADSTGRNGQQQDGIGTTRLVNDEGSHEASCT